MAGLMEQYRVYYYNKDLVESGYPSAWDNYCKNKNANVLKSLAKKANAMVNDFTDQSAAHLEVYNRIDGNKFNLAVGNQGDLQGVWTSAIKIGAGANESFQSVSRAVGNKVSAKTAYNYLKNFMDGPGVTKAQQYIDTYKQFITQLENQLDKDQVKMLQDLIIKGSKDKKSGIPSLEEIVKGAKINYNSMSGTIAKKVNAECAKAIAANEMIALQPQHVEAFLLGHIFNELMSQGRASGKALSNNQLFNLREAVRIAGGIITSVGGQTLNEAIGAIAAVEDLKSVFDKVDTSLTGKDRIKKTESFNKKKKAIDAACTDQHISKGDFSLTVTHKGQNVTLGISLKTTLKGMKNNQLKTTNIRGLKMAQGITWKSALDSYGANKEDKYMLANASTHHKGGNSNTEFERFKQAKTIVNKMGLLFAFSGADKALFVNVNGRYISIATIFEKLVDESMKGKQQLKFIANTELVTNVWVGDEPNLGDAKIREQKVIDAMYNLHLDEIRWNLYF